MSLNLRIFLAYFLTLSLAITLLLNTLLTEIKPATRQATEDALLEISNLLAEVVSSSLTSNRVTEASLSQSSFPRAVSRFQDRRWNATIFSIKRQQSTFRIYVTDERGIVAYDSDNIALGEDYSQWNDVYLTLRGEYGARSSPAVPGDEINTVMHVAAPIYRGDEIIGVVSVAKPNQAVEPFINLASGKVRLQGAVIVLIGLVLAMAMSFWLTRSIRKLTQYAEAIRKNEAAPLPKMRETELSRLATAMEEMRRELEGKSYVETFVHELTHELKSPVSAIRGASEILQELMDSDQSRHFLDNIDSQTRRIDETVTRLLKIVSVEKQKELENPVEVDLKEILSSVLLNKETQILYKKLTITEEQVRPAIVKGDIYLLTQAIDNLIQNAIDFSPLNSTLTLSIQTGQQTVFTVTDEGPGIPEYAIERIFERFYSLPRPDTEKKSTGLGLGFVRHIMALHQGTVTVTSFHEEAKTGTTARLIFPPSSINTAH